MRLLTFNGKTWKTASKPSTQDYQEVELYNAGRQQCHITFNPTESFGLDYIGLAAESKIRLKFQKHKPTDCTAYVCAAEAAHAARAGAAESTPDARKQGTQSRGTTDPQVTIPAMRGLPEPQGVGVTIPSPTPRGESGSGK